MKSTIFACLLSLSVGPAAAVASDVPDMGTIRDTIVEVFEDDKKLRDTDIIDQKQVLAVLKTLRDDEGWEIPDWDDVMKRTLSPTHTLVVTLRTPRGHRFMRQVSKYKLIYDRLDRISRVSGGKELIKAIVKLPDAARYAKFSTRREVPGLVDLLPKQRNGKTRKIANYKKPTHRVYTLRDLEKRLEISRAVALRNEKSGN